MLLVLLALPESAATQGSRIVPLDHWAYEEIRLLQERGLLTGLNPLAQPYRARELEVALAALDPDSLAEPVAGWVRVLLGEFGKPIEQSRTRWGVAAQAGAHASTGRRLDPLRHFGQEDVWPWWRAGGWLEHGIVAVESRLYGDTWLVEDPDGRDPGQRRGGRGDHSYLGVTVSGFDVTIGRFSRNWAGIGDTGLMVSSVPTPYPQLELHADLGPLSLRSFTGELDTLAGGKRYLSGHEVTWRHGDLALAVGEAILYSGASGGFNLRYLNPAEYLFFDADNEPEDLSINLLLNVRAWYRVGDVTLLGEGMLDDFSVNRPRAPTRYAGRLEARWTPVTSRVAATLVYERVSSFAYRANRPEDGYRYLERGLAQNHADYELLALTADLFPPLSGLRLSVGGQLLRQGEGDIRVPFPADYDQFLTSPALHLGVVETTARLRFAGRYRPARFVWMSWDLGPNFITNRFHQDGVSATTFGGVLDIGLRFDLPLSSG